MTSLHMARVSDFSTFRLTTVNTVAHGTRQFLVVDSVAPGNPGTGAASPVRLFAVSDRRHPFFFHVFPGHFVSAGRGIAGVMRDQRVGFEPLMEEAVTPESVGLRWDYDAYGENPDPAAFLPGWADEETTVETRLERPALCFGAFHDPSSGGKMWDARKVATWLDREHWVLGYRVWAGWSRLLSPQNWVLVGVPANCAQAWQAPAYDEMLQMERRHGVVKMDDEAGNVAMARKLSQMGQRWHDLGESTLARTAFEWAIESYMGTAGGGTAADEIFARWNPVYHLGEMKPLFGDSSVDDESKIPRYWPNWFGNASHAKILRDHSVALRSDVSSEEVAHFLSRHLGHSTEEWRQYFTSWCRWYPSRYRDDDCYAAVMMQGAQNSCVGLWREGDWDAHFFDRYGFSFAEGGHATFGGRLVVDPGALAEQLAAIAANMKDTPLPDPTPLRQSVGDDHAFAFADRA